MPLAEQQECDSVGEMGAQEELTAILRDAAEAAIAGGLPVLTYEGYADAVVAAGWRPPPRLITDPAELGDLPDGAVILDPLGVPRQRAGSLWVAAAGGSLTPDQVPLPGTVLHTPQAG